jgi:hypothetical protein
MDDRFLGTPNDPRHSAFGGGHCGMRTVVGRSFGARSLVSAFGTVDDLSSSFVEPSTRAIGPEDKGRLTYVN